MKARSSIYCQPLNALPLIALAFSLSFVISEVAWSQDGPKVEHQVANQAASQAIGETCTRAQWTGHWRPALISEAESGQDAAHDLSESICECVLSPLTPQGSSKHYDRVAPQPLTRAQVDAQCTLACRLKTCEVPHPATRALVRYPDTRRGDVVETLHGETLADPYRWLEDDRSEETAAWVQEQVRVTRAYLDKLSSREALRAEIEGVWNYAKMSTPVLRGDPESGQLFYTYNDGLQNQSTLYTRRVDESHDQARKLLDPNQLSKEGTTALKRFVVDRRGHLVAYQYASAGSDWVEIKVRDVRSGHDLKDHLKWIKFSDLSWDRRGEGFYYSRYDAPKEGSKLTGVNEFQKLYYHRLGDDQSQDQLIYARADQPSWGFSGEVSEDGTLLIISVWQGASEKNQLFYKRLDQPNAPVVALIDHFKNSYTFLGNRGEQLWLQTDRDAPRGQVITMRLDQADPSAYRVVVPEQPEALTRAQLVSGRLALHYLKHASSRVRFFNLWGVDQGELPDLGVGTIGSLTGGDQSSVSYLAFASFTQPTAIHRYDHARSELREVFKPQLAISTQDLITEQVFIKSSEGAQIPAFIISKRASKPAQAQLKPQPKPTVLYGYGGFNISLTPYFKPDLLPWLNRGGVYVIANLRGGGEYGEAWHKAGMRGNKQNVFDDFIAVAQWLIDKGRTRADLLGIYGGSNGGLLVGACAQQRPDLFAAAVPAVGVMDMLRFHLFTIGWAWIPEYGDPKEAEDFKVLRAYSPLHNLSATRAPATLVMTADHDDRVVPAHSFKYAAQLQATHRGGGPALIRIDTQAGHGAGTPTSKRIESAADLWGFFSHHLKLTSTRTRAQ